MTDPDEPRSERGHGTPEGYTKEEPAADELGQPGTPGAGMTPDVPHAADAEDVEHGDTSTDPVDAESAASVAHHDDSTHMDAHTVLSDDDHGHSEAALGPVDWAAWSYALIGVAAGVIVIVLFAIALG